MKTSRSLVLSGKGLTELAGEAVETAVEAGVQGVDLSKNMLTQVAGSCRDRGWEFLGD